MSADHAGLVMTIQTKPKHVRNVCVCAHIDHGKTTLVDSLLASNNLITKEHSGQLRQMDYLYSEQERHITLKASAVSLLHLSDDSFVRSIFVDPTNEDSAGKKIPMLINIVDTPGHCDFTSEVLAATSICDGALLLLDSIEGVASQTMGVLNHLVKLQLDVILVINKLDRLYYEVNMTTLEVYFRLLQLINEANDAYAKTCVELGFSSSSPSSSSPTKLIGETKEYFSPVKGNVVFASAIGNWGFSLSSFASLLARKYPFIAEMQSDRNLLLKNLWDANIVIDLRSGCFKKANNSVEPAFVTLILNKIWSLFPYNQSNLDVTVKKLTKMSLKYMNKPLEQSFMINATSSSLVKNFLSAWLPLSDAIFNTIAVNVKNPLDSNNIIVRSVKESLNAKIMSLFDSFNPVLIMCGKVLNKRDLDSFKDSSGDSKSVFLLCKVLMGNVTTNQTFNVLNYVGKQKICNVTFPTVTKKFYCPIIQSIFPYSNANIVPHEGNLCIIEVSTHIPFGSLLIDANTAIKLKEKMKDLFDSSNSRIVDVNNDTQMHESALNSLRQLIKKLDASRYIKTPLPLIQVSISPSSLNGYPQLIEALKTLNSVDNSACYHISRGNGEIILSVSGDVHLDRCCEQLDDFLAEIHGEEKEEGYYSVGDTAIHLKEHVLPGRCASDLLCNESLENVEVSIADQKLGQLDNEDTIIHAFLNDSSSDSPSDSPINQQNNSQIDEFKNIKANNNVCTVELEQSSVLCPIFAKIDAHLSTFSKEDRICNTKTLQLVKAASNRFNVISTQAVLDHYYQLCGSSLVIPSLLPSSVQGLSLSKCGYPTGMELLHIHVIGDDILLTVHTFAFVCTANSYFSTVFSNTNKRTDIQILYEDVSSKGEITDYQSKLFYYSVSDDQFPGLFPALIDSFKCVINAGPLCEEPVTNMALLVIHNVIMKKKMSYAELVEQNQSSAFESMFRSTILSGFYVHSTLSYILTIPIFTKVMQKSLSYANIFIAEKFVKATVKVPPQLNLQNLQSCFDRMRCIKGSIDFKLDGVSEYVVYVPISNSLLFQIELRKEGGGRLTIELKPHRYLLLEEDPRHSDIALDDEELIEWGQQGKYKENMAKGDERLKKRDALSLVCGKYLSRRLQISVGLHYSGSNNAKRLVETVKRDKGLLLLQGIVIEAEKQRTIKRNR